MATVILSSEDPISTRPAGSYVYVCRHNYNSIQWRLFQIGNFVQNAHAAGPCEIIEKIVCDDDTLYLGLKAVPAVPKSPQMLEPIDPVTDLIDHIEAMEDNSDVPEEFRHVPETPYGLEWPIEVYARDTDHSEHIAIKIIRRDPTSHLRKGIILKIPWDYLDMVAVRQELRVRILPDKDTL